MSAHETGFCWESASDCEYALRLGFGDVSFNQYICILFSV